jgi:hypothetical protein
MLSPLAVTEVVGTGTRGQNQEVIDQFTTVQNEASVIGINALYFGKQNSRVGLLPKDSSDGGRNVGCRKAGCCNLVQEGLKQMVVLAVDDGYAYRCCFK